MQLLIFEKNHILYEENELFIKFLKIIIESCLKVKILELLLFIY